MKKSTNVKLLVLTALCIAIGIVLPIAFHSIPNSGKVLLPMHLPVLLCGIICGPIFGLICGIITPLLSSLMTGMPPMAILPSMICELAVYGIISGIIIKVIKSKNNIINIYISLISAMIIGRIIYGVLNAFIFSAGKYSMELWLSASFITALPGIIIQIVFIPIIIIALQKAKIINL